MFQQHFQYRIWHFQGWISIYFFNNSVERCFSNLKKRNEQLFDESHKLNQGQHWRDARYKFCLKNIDEPYFLFFYFFAYLKFCNSTKSSK